MCSRVYVKGLHTRKSRRDIQKNLLYEMLTNIITATPAERYGSLYRYQVVIIAYLNDKYT